MPTARTTYLRTCRILPILAVWLTILGQSCRVAKASTSGPTNERFAAIVPTAGDGEKDGWTVEGISKLSRQWLWYRKGLGFAGQHAGRFHLTRAEQTRDLTSTATNPSGPPINAEGDDNLLPVAGRKASPAIVGQIERTEPSSPVTDFHFFQYMDYEFERNSVGDAVQVPPLASGLFDSAHQNKGGRFFADDLLGPNVTAGKLGSYPWSYNKLGSGFPATLNGITGPITGDVAWAFQWDAAIPVAGAYQGPLDQKASLASVPEPSMIALISLAFMLLLLLARRRAG